MQEGSWVKCHDTWLTCVNANEWSSCYNRIMNNTTKLCDFWPYGKFYTPQLGTCEDWRKNWLEEWGYRDECFVWPQGMKYDLTLLQWVDNCTSDQVFIQDPILRNTPLCRDLTYYIDPDSIKSIELGTLKYPYKKMSLSTMEVLNFISHTNKNVTIYIKEESFIPVATLTNFYIDFPNII